MNESQKGPIFTDIVLEVFKVGGLLVSEGDEMGSEFGITSARWKVLGAIFLAGEAQTVSQIARSMGLTRQAVQRLVDTMHKDNLVLFRSNPEHKRAKLVELSDHGKAIYSKLDQKQTEWAAYNSNDIGHKDLKVALSVLKRIAEKLES
ncbi:MarR family winged helix-turn-helix transcriptional regulator [Microbulbifer sp. ZKSA006]|uniref:MarR family winged helix-turn-helix transcriptional regulator n=1 Tax=Microbulbifer sp. ZKSA006 TaxID=3243390 RepID=UPI00403996E8